MVEAVAEALDGAVELLFRFMVTDAHDVVLHGPIALT
jgi:hypothetical protein